MNARVLHAGSWWIWALGLAVCASLTTNPLLLLLVFAVAVLVATLRMQPSTPTSAMTFYIRLALIIIALRVFIQVLFGAAMGHTVLLTLPAVPFPEWLAGVKLGGPIALESLLAALYDGMRLATIIVCIGAANALASPARLLKSAPAALYEVGVSLVVAMSFTPQLVNDFDRVRVARRLRGRRSTGLRAMASSTVPVFEGALERSITLAAAMDARGYGRVGVRSAKQRALGNGLLIGALLCALFALYAFVAPDAPTGSGALMLIGCVGLGAAAIALASRARVRTVYRPTPWRGPEWVTSGAGITAATLFILGSTRFAAEFYPSTDPAVWPTVPFIAAVALLVSVTPLAVSRKVSP